MMKILLLTFLAVGLTAGLKLGSKAKTQQRLKATLEAECERYDANDKAASVVLEMGNALECMYNSLESTNTTVEFDELSTKAVKLAELRAICKVRTQLRGCIHDMIGALLPCASASVQTQAEDLKKAITELFDYVCEDNCRRVSDFLDGGYDCLEAKTDTVNACTEKVDLFSDILEDTTTNEAFDACHRYDEMMVCLLNVVDDCPTTTAKKFLEDVLTMFRKGTYCHVTIPLPEKPATNEDNQL